MNAAALLLKAAALGVRVVQIADNLPLHRLALTDLETLRRRAAQLNIAIEVGARGTATDHLRTYLEIARRLGASLLRVVVDTADHRPEAHEVPPLVAKLVPDLERSGIRLAIENHDRFTAATFGEIIRHVGSPWVGICLDTVNSFGALEGPEVVVRTLAPRVLNLHVKDFTVRRADHQMGFTIEGTPAGRGRLDVPWLLRKLKEAGRDPNAILELWTPPAPTIEETVAREGAWAAESITYLRTLIKD
jgi:sugar phosphate isomerase/epimerase